VAKLKLLIIEDDADQLELMRETLEDYFGRGTVTGVGTAREALAQDAESYDLVLCDYNLPDGSGMDVLETIVNRSSTPVLMSPARMSGRSPPKPSGAARATTS
jgi:CheY-like chemotaxis protein